MKKFLLLTIVSTSVVFFASSFKTKKKETYQHFRTSGAAANFDDGYVGAPFAAGSCGNCHAGGTYAPTLSVQLLSGSSPVTSYTAGVNYTLRLTITPTSGSPTYGFQTTSVNAATENNINNWGAALPAGVTNIAVSSGRNYVEQSAKLTSGIIDIPWTAPATSTGTVRFYSIGNAVNSNGGTSGDNATTTNIFEISEATVPVKLVSFNATQMKEQISLFWETAQESNSSYFDIERSNDGLTFKPIGKLNAQGNSNILTRYSFNDKFYNDGISYYRLAQYDLDGRLEYSKIISTQASRNKNIVEISPNPVANVLNVKTSFKLAGAKYSVVNNAGIQILSGIFIANEIDVKQLLKGNYFLRVEQANKTIITTQFVK